MFTHAHACSHMLTHEANAPPVPRYSGLYKSVSCVARRGCFRTCRGQRVRFVEAKRTLLPPRLEFAVSRFLLPHLAASLRFQKCRKRRDHSPKKFSGLRLARQDAQHSFYIVFYNENWPQTSQTLGSFNGFREAPRRPPGSSQEIGSKSRLQDPPPKIEILKFCFSKISQKI